jgi:recombination protein RecT
MTDIVLKDRKAELLAEIERQQDRFLALLPPTLPFRRFNEIVSMALVRNPDLILCTRPSVVMSCLQAAELGLEVGGVLGEAYLVPFKNKGVQECSLIIGYKGLVSLAYQSERVTSIRPVLVFEGEEFDVGEGSKPFIHHKPNYSKPRAPDGSDVTHAYTVVHLGDACTFSVVPRWELEEVRTKARGASKPGSPWNTNRRAMYRKTPTRRVCNSIPLSEGLKKGIHYDADSEVHMVKPKQDLLEELRAKHGDAPTDELQGEIVT